MRLVGLVDIVVEAFQERGLGVVGPEDEEARAGFGEVLVDGRAGGGLETLKGRGEREKGQSDVEGEGEDDGLVLGKEEVGG